MLHLLWVWWELKGMVWTDGCSDAEGLDQEGSNFAALQSLICSLYYIHFMEWLESFKKKRYAVQLL